MCITMKQVITSLRIIVDIQKTHLMSLKKLIKISLTGIRKDEKKEDENVVLQ